jgi:hypothetical protein
VAVRSGVVQPVDRLPLGHSAVPAATPAVKTATYRVAVGGKTAGIRW